MTKAFKRQVTVVNIDVHDTRGLIETAEGALTAIIVLCKVLEGKGIAVREELDAAIAVVDADRHPGLKRSLEAVREGVYDR